MRIHHLNCGTMRPFGGRLVNDGGSLLTGRMVCHCLLIETEAGLVLIDSGIGSEDMERPPGSLPRVFLRVTRPRLDVEESAVRQVARLGYAPGDVRHIILTHLDLDHAGGLRDFPRARVHVAEAELAAAMAPVTRNDRGRYRKAQWAHDPDWVTYGAPDGERWFGFDAVRQLTGLPPELLLIPLAGHTRGHTAIAVQSSESGASRWLLHAGDAYFFHGEVDPARPRSTPVLSWFQNRVQVDGAARVHNQERLRELAASHSDAVDIFSAHDPVELDRFTRSSRTESSQSGVRRMRGSASL